MSDNIIPFPDIGRQLTSREKHFLDNVRQDFAPTLKRMFPRTSDGGKTEFESVTQHFNVACEQVVKEMHARFKDAYAKADLVTMFHLRQGCVDAFFNRFKDWSKDDLL